MDSEHEVDIETVNDIDESDWGEPVPVTVRREVTISVRFSAEEIAAIRRRAQAAGMKVTAYIRQAAASGEVQVDREKVARAVAAVTADLDRVRALVGGAA